MFLTTCLEKWKGVYLICVAWTANRWRQFLQFFTCLHTFFILIFEVVNPFLNFWMSALKIAILVAYRLQRILVGCVGRLIWKQKNILWSDMRCLSSGIVPYVTWSHITSHNNVCGDLENAISFFLDHMNWLLKFISMKFTHRSLQWGSK